MLSLFPKPRLETQRETDRRVGVGVGTEWGRGGLLRRHFLPLG